MWTPHSIISSSFPNLPIPIRSGAPPGSDSYEQLEVACKITAVAVAARACRLEHEAAHLRQKLAAKDRLTAELAERADALDRALRCGEPH
jgi:hypothetical protein